MRIHTVPYQTSNSLGLGRGRFGSPFACVGRKQWTSNQGSFCSGQCSEHCFGRCSKNHIWDPVEFTNVCFIQLDNDKYYLFKY